MCGKLNNHKVWKATTSTILLLLAIQFNLMAFFKQKEILTNKTNTAVNAEPSDRKLILLLIDALREDFIDFGSQDVSSLRIDPSSESAYKGQKLTLFNKLREEYPDRTLLFPAESASPTVTVVRVKNVGTGSVSTIFETTNEFQQSEISEDHFFH